MGAIRCLNNQQHDCVNEVLIDARKQLTAKLNVGEKQKSEKRENLRMWRRKTTVNRREIRPESGHANKCTKMKLKTGERCADNDGGGAYLEKFFGINEKGGRTRAAEMWRLNEQDNNKNNQTIAQPKMN